jgi:hypothetical protein
MRHGFPVVLHRRRRICLIHANALIGDPSIVLATVVAPRYYCQRLVRVVARRLSDRRGPIRAWSCGHPMRPTPTTMIATELAHAALAVLTLVGSSAALVGFGFAWGRFRALAVLTALWTIPPVASDILYYGFGVNLIGYCGEPVCDPGPIPASISAFFLPFPLFLAAVGVRLRQRETIARTRAV